MATSEKEDVLAAVTGFMESFANTKPPFSETLSYLLPESFAVSSYPGGVVQSTLADFVLRLEERLLRIYEAGAISADQTLVEPGPDVWVHERFAAVWSGYSFKVEGEQKMRGSAVLSLIRRDEGWKIAAIADTLWGEGDAPPPPVREATPELMAPILEYMQLLNDKKEIFRPLLPGGGVTVARFPAPPKAILWPELYETMKGMLERAPGYVEHLVMDWEGRIVGDLGFVWSPFTVTLDGKLKIRGYNIFTLLKKDGKWLISGIQDG